jgi:phosphatidylglycerophosphate synthase
MISKKEFYRLYNRNSQENPNRNLGNLIDKIWRREISLHVAYFFAKHHVSANQITILYFTLSIIANVLFTIPSIFTLISLIIAYELIYILDVSDGQLARYYGTISKFGEMLDISFDILMNAFFVLAFGIRIFFESRNFVFLILGGLGAISYILESSWIEKSEEVTEKYEKQEKSSMLNRLRSIYVSLDNMTVLSIVISFLYLINIFFQKTYLLGIFFSFYVTSIFGLKIIFRLYCIYKHTLSVEKKEWKGWR